MITIDGKEYDPETFEGEAKVHFEQVASIREQLGQISNQIGQQQAGLNLQVALGWREQSLISAVTASEDDDEEAA